MVPPAGFEPATHGVETHCSIHWATEACVQPMKATFHDNYHLTTVSSWCQEQLFQGCSKSLVKLFQVKGKTQDVFAGKSSLQMTLIISILDNQCGKCKHHPIKKHTIILWCLSLVRLWSCHQMMRKQGGGKQHYFLQIAHLITSFWCSHRLTWTTITL